jgi:hypothetical protein
VFELISFLMYPLLFVVGVWCGSGVLYEWWCASGSVFSWVAEGWWCAVDVVIQLLVFE